MNQAGYSKNPLSKKLGLKPSHSIYLVNPPDKYWTFFETLPEGIHEIENPKEESVDFVHLFCTTMVDLKKHSIECKYIIKKTGLLWVSWPKGSSKRPTDLKRDSIREHLLGIGLVDVKVVAIN